MIYIRLDILNRVSNLLPHHPESRGNLWSKCFSCKNKPPMLPGPEFKYLLKKINTTFLYLKK